MSEENSFRDVSEEECEDIQKTENGRKRRQNFTMDFKKQVVDFANKTNNRKAAEKFNVSRQCVQKWKAYEPQLNEELEKAPFAKKKRFDGAGRPLLDAEFDEELITWIRENRKKKNRVTRNSIKIFARSKKDGFKATNGWLESFLRRHSLVARRATTVCQKPPEEFVNKIIDFVLYVEKIMMQNKYTHVYGCDETAVYLDFSKSLTVEQKGAKEVAVKTTGHDKLHITIMLCARSDGYKCRPFVLLPNKRPIPSIIARFGRSLELSWCGRTFFNDTVTAQFLRSIIGSSLFGKRLLIWDAFRSHTSQDTKRILRDLRVDTAVVPGGTTKYLQVVDIDLFLINILRGLQCADVYWNAPFKSKIRQLYEDWMLHGSKSYTKGGNMRAPPMETYLGWIAEAWDSIPVELIIRSFVGCGVGIKSDGTEDELIHCFRSEEFGNAIEMLKQKRNDLRDNEAIIELEERMEEVEIENEENSDEEYFNSDPSIDLVN